MKEEIKTLLYGTFVLYLFNPLIGIMLSAYFWTELFYIPVLSIVLCVATIIVYWKVWMKIRSKNYTRDQEFCRRTGINTAA